MKTSELVRKLLDAGAGPEAVEIALEAVEQAADEAREEAQPKRRRRTQAKRPELVTATR